MGYRHTLARAASLAVACLALAGVAGVAAGDTLVLRDGSSLEGTIKKAPGGYDVVAADGTRTFVADTQVAAFRLTGKPATRPGGGGGDVDDAGLASLRRSVDNLDDLKLIVARYERFVEQSKDKPAVAAAATEDLERYRQLRADGYVKFNGEWVAPGERADALRATYLDAAEARRQIKDGDLAAARATVAKMLAADAGDVSANYLGGVLAQRDGDVTAARNYFEKVRRKLPKHAPTLVNLAAINVKYNQQARALAFLGDAMRSEPNNKDVLDGVAEALAMLDDRTAKSHQADVTRKVFEQQDAVLQRQMKERGLYRWGSKWVGGEDYAKLKALDDEVRGNVNRLQAQQAGLRQQAQQIDRQAADLTSYLANLEQSRNYVDKEGRVVQGPLPPEYYNAQARQRELLNQRQGLELEVGRLNAAVAQEKARLPTPAYDGQIRPVGEDGVPVTLPPEPAAAAPEAAPEAAPPAADGDGAEAAGPMDDAPGPATQPAAADPA